MASPDQLKAIAAWKLVLNDESSLLENPGRHHKVLVQEAHALMRAQVIDRDDLSDMLELADGALEYAIELELNSPQQTLLINHPSYRGLADVILSSSEGDVHAPGLKISLEHTSPCTRLLGLPDDCPSHAVGHAVTVRLPDGKVMDGSVTWSGRHSLVFSVCDEFGMPRCRSS